MDIFIQKREQSPDTVTVLKTYFQSNVADTIGTVFYTMDHTHFLVAKNVHALSHENELKGHLLAELTEDMLPLASKFE